MSEPVTVGLRIDVDTFRGTRDGVPALVELLRKYGIRASFFMSVGPDNMGRHLWRLLKPQFLWKMLRSNAASLYGYDILLRGTAWPGPRIGDRLSSQVRLPKEAGHEVGLHAWDHYRWQTHTDRLSEREMESQTRRGVENLAEINGTPPDCSAAAGWRANETCLQVKEKFAFRYNSDCRGTSIFTPVVAGMPLTVQIPVTLPTYDEIIGSDGITKETYNEHILRSCLPGKLNVYTIHAEAEGIAIHAMFEDMLMRARDRNIRFVPLCDLLDRPAPQGEMIKRTMPGREGWLAWQA